MHGFYAVQLFSHKVLRRLVVFPLIALLLITPLLWFHGTFYRFVLLAQVLFYGTAFLGTRLKGAQRGPLKLLAIPYYFCMVNIAALFAALNIIRGHRIECWEPQRTETTSTRAGGSL